MRQNTVSKEQQFGKIQEERIETWAKASGCWVADTSIYKQTLGEKIGLTLHQTYT